MMRGLRLTFINVGYGEAILLETADRTHGNGVFRALIDGGSADPEEYDDTSSGRIPVIRWLERKGISQIDLLVNTHIHEDHTSGLKAEAERYRPACFWQELPPLFYQAMTPLPMRQDLQTTEKKFLSSVNDYRDVCRILAAKGCEIRQLNSESTCLTPAEHLNISVLAPTPEREELLERMLAAISTAPDQDAARTAANRADAAMNNFSLMLMIEYAGRRILLPGDTNQNGYGHLKDADLRADIFKVGHHGQKDGISRDIFRRIKPEYVICCASSDRRYGSASPEILKMMREEGAELTFSDCPDVPGQTDNLEPHNALIYEISEDGRISFRYEI
ncbi:MAG: MBL fold metallo-hydrolase [Lachnospiraceae bacterium]|jgi:competence protein ComEC|nr:MBL fold metallo-hydrolase [Lachnospiraceae bacterium]MCI1328584.1 MBL fold metallo-hydrolase [Lachnospiraceae bacterium]